MGLFTATLFLLVPFSVCSAIYSKPIPVTNAMLIPVTLSGNTNCSAAVSIAKDSRVTARHSQMPATIKSPSCLMQKDAGSDKLHAINGKDYGNWTALPSQNDNPIQHLESISFAVSNAANSVSTVCAFPLSATLVGGVDGLTSAAYLFPFKGAFPAARGRNRARSDSVEPTWQACADRKDTDGKHRFTIATGAAFGLAERSLAVNQTWFCHDETGRL
ncbi:hypothetical protein F5Y09DRAFT_337964 [Xylaria sp. FL1042]|nr:hypothetical protein F5Y09DRAFT_337964 [Xylaria sp. FL1042]